jgi:hypothetical protein
LQDVKHTAAYIIVQQPPDTLDSMTLIPGSRPLLLLLLLLFIDWRTFLQKGQPWNSYSSMGFTGRLKVPTWQPRDITIMFFPLQCVTVLSYYMQLYMGICASACRNHMRTEGFKDNVLEDTFISNVF